MTATAADDPFNRPVHSLWMKPGDKPVDLFGG